MPYHVDELRREEPFPVTPETNEHAALRFLVANHDYGFTPSEIAAETKITEGSASKTMSRLHEKGLVSRSQGAYYVDPERVESLKHRLESLDAAVDLFDDAPDDAYANAGWEEQLSELDPGDEPASGETDDTDAETLVSNQEANDEA
ncbi:MarR family transcriptional regulator [Halonotius sp. F2-221B]|uniref:MarR family transcriptional regulator n=1 Tax=Halonotius sp. F2-221B TaxID=2731620 RepID=UPI00398B8D23